MRRILGLILALTLLVTLLPFGAMATEQEDTGFKASTELIEIIKKWEGFSKYPYEDYGQYTVGYGTRAPDEHLARYFAEGISEEEATELLAQFMNDMGASVNNFIKKHNLNATQGMFDAMLSLTYNCGSRWMVEVSTLRTAILDGWTGSDFLFAFGQWSTAGGVTLTGLVRRRLAECNMYLNGQYSTTLPANYCFVQFNPNGGNTSVKTQGYDSNDENVAIRATATYANYTFDGWYTDPTGGEKVEKLDASVNGYTLYAHWRSGSGSGLPSDTPGEQITGTKVSYSREITALTLNAFDQPVKGALVVDTLGQYEIVDIVAEYTDSNGVKWGKIDGIGWINLSYTQEPNQGDETVKVTVTVTGSGVNVRRGPGLSYAAVATANAGDKLEITRTATADGYTWGKFSKGWIALKYTNYDEVVNENLDSDNTKPVMGTVNVNEFLRIREEPSVSAAVLGTLGPNDRVEILEQKAVGGTIWGRIDRGWISMDYVILDKEEETTPPTTEPEETTPPTTEPEETTPPTTEPEETTPPATEPEQPEEPAALTGKVALKSGYLNVRSGPSTGYKICGKYANGAEVTILEQKTVGTVEWGRTEKGWVSMTYIKLDAPQTPEEPTEPETPTQPEQPSDPEPTQLKGKVSLVSGCLRIRSGAGTGNKIVGNLYNGNTVTILEQKTVGGVTWGRIDKGWICMDYVKLISDSTSDGDSKVITGTVNVNEFLRIRSGAGTNYALVGYYYPKNKVTITETKMVGGTKWGRTDRGWISMDYIIVDGEDNNQSGGDSNVITGTVVLQSGGLYIRSAAGTGSTIVGSLQNGAKVTILETKMVGTTKWGRIEKGWICMDYVKLD